jgi:SHS2 domain-containing protein
VATSTYIHVWISFNFTQILDTKNTIEQYYELLLDKHEEPFKTIPKTTIDVNLLTISASIKDYQDVIKALPQTTEISEPGRLKRFVAIGLAIAAPSTHTGSQLNSEILSLKLKTDLLIDISHLHEAHLHHLEEKTYTTNKLLADLLESNVWFTAKLKDAVEKKFQLVVHHHGQVCAASPAGSRCTPSRRSVANVIKLFTAVILSLSA